MTYPPAPSVLSEELIASLARRSTTILSSLIPRGSSVALVDFPNYPNVGDSMIWLGERSYLDANAASIVYTCEQSNYSEDELRSRLNGATILIHGGGNLGDLYPHHERFRETILKAFPRNRIIQLPQSIFFREKANLKRAMRVLNAHPDFTLLTREIQSFEFARKQFRGQCILCPDSAFMLGTLTRSMPPEREALWLLRTDMESCSQPPPIKGLNMEITDWMQEPNLCPPPQSTLKTYDLLAKTRVDRGSGILSRGKVIITDRLHGHVLSLLLGIPNILLDNNYGKIRSFYETWTQEFPLVQWAKSSKVALKLARPNSTRPLHDRFVAGIRRYIP